MSDCERVLLNGHSNETGSVARGLAADLIRWSLSDSASLCYHFGYPVAHQTMVAGLWLER